MTKEEINEGNKLIAEFMNKEMYLPLWKTGKYESFHSTKEECQNLINNSPFLISCSAKVGIIDLHYHSSWDWLMPVIRRGKQSPNSAEWNWEFLNRYLLRCEIAGTFTEVIEFIKWYNSLTTNNRTNDKYKAM